MKASKDLIIVNFRNKKIKIPAKKVSEFGKITGLMFKSKKTKNLLFEFKKKTRIGIHSWFVFFDFYAVWLNEKNKIIEIKVIKPFSIIYPKKEFSKLVELAVNKKNSKILELLRR